jgi:hypothetical protein
LNKFIEFFIYFLCHKIVANNFYFPIQWRDSNGSRSEICLYFYFDFNHFVVFLLMRFYVKNMKYQLFLNWKKHNVRKLMIDSTHHIAMFGLTLKACSVSFDSIYA